MMKIKTGLIKKVLNEEQFEMIKNNLIDPKDLMIIDTIKTYVNRDGVEIEYLPIRLSSRETDRDGNEKFIYDKEKDEYMAAFSTTNILYAYGKELRIILELGEHHPIKIVYEENIETKMNKIICVQDQSIGTLV